VVALVAALAATGAAVVGTGPAAVRIGYAVALVLQLAAAAVFGHVSVGAGHGTVRWLVCTGCGTAEQAGGAADRSRAATGGRSVGPSPP
jgi:hypothetical protein